MQSKPRIAPEEGSPSSQSRAPICHLPRGRPRQAQAAVRPHGGDTGPPGTRLKSPPPGTKMGHCESHLCQNHVAPMHGSQQLCHPHPYFGKDKSEGCSVIQKIHITAECSTLNCTFHHHEFHGHRNKPGCSPPALRLGGHGMRGGLPETAWAQLTNLGVVLLTQQGARARVLWGCRVTMHALHTTGGPGVALWWAQPQRRGPHRRSPALPQGKGIAVC